METTPFPRPDWSPLPHTDCRGVQGRVLLKTGALAVAMLRFDVGGTVHEHPAGYPIDVLCLEGSGMTSVGDEWIALAAGQSVRWPADVPHRLWTEGATMTTLMIEHLDQKNSR